MKPRVLIFEDSDILRKTLKNLLENLGYEVYTFSDPSLCPIMDTFDHICPLDHACSDIIISDVNMPSESGLDFIKNRLKKGCKIEYRALMSADWTDSDLEFAQKLGCRIFYKPFNIEKLLQWLAVCRKKLDPARKLIEWPTKSQQEFLG